MENNSNNNEKVLKIGADQHVRDDMNQPTLTSLNMECFLMILDYLDSKTLMDLCEASDQFRKNICFYKHILSRKLFEIDEFVDVSS